MENTLSIKKRNSLAKGFSSCDLIKIDLGNSLISFSESDSVRFHFVFLFVFVVGVVNFFVGPVVHYSSRSPTSVGNLPKEIPVRLS